ncbi:ThuA domain-containing protein [Verrucomicrobiaceae bacterium N1E253]|uniref:ThuA domain-containing protein n=2 Tax=Oceaniferula marina TaxID=2748318 RepID=A0A851GID6_9BACT|nr:ThuA domain-containing protein [Oceaniferula marina]
MNMTISGLLTAAVLTTLGVNEGYAGDRKVEIAKALEGLEVEKAKAPRKMLVFTLTRGFKHASIKTGELMMQLMAEKSGAFDVVVSNDLANFEPENLKHFDAVCFLNTTLEVFSPAKGAWAKMSEDDRKVSKENELRLKKSLMDFIKSGKGFVGIHAATDTFYEWPEYGEMIGGYFNGHPWNAKTQVSVKVEDGQEKHTCCAHLDGKNLEFKEEIYQFKAPYDPKKLHILLRLDPEKMDLSIGKRADKDYAVSWVKHHGKGRVFYCSLGHNHHIYENPKVLQHYLRGMQWAIGDVEAEVKVGQ